MSGQIGMRQFLLLTGAVPAVKTELDVIRIPGEDGHILRRIGQRSPQFQLQGGQHFSTDIAARNELEQYTALIEQVPQTLVKDGLNYSTEGTLSQRYLVNVLNAEQVSLEQKACIAGTSDTWWLVSSWTLLLVPTI